MKGAWIHRRELVKRLGAEVKRGALRFAFAFREMHLFFGHHSTCSDCRSLEVFVGRGADATLLLAHDSLKHSPMETMELAAKKVGRKTISIIPGAGLERAPNPGSFASVVSNINDGPQPKKILRKRVCVPGVWVAA